LEVDVAIPRSGDDKRQTGDNIERGEHPVEHPKRFKYLADSKLGFQEYGGNHTFYVTSLDEIHGSWFLSTLLDTRRRTSKGGSSLEDHREPAQKGPIARVPCDMLRDHGIDISRVLQLEELVVWMSTAIGHGSLILV
jgi:hypothetical protein